MPEPEPQWISLAQAMEAEGVSRREIFNRCNPSDPARLIWKHNPSGRGRVFDLCSLRGADDSGGWNGSWRKPAQPLKQGSYLRMYRA